MTRYGMAIDINRCFGCHACEAACKIANNLPKKLAYNVVYTKSDDDYTTEGTAVIKGAVGNDRAGGTFENAYLGYFPINCFHCDNAACVSVCPTGATTKDSDGIVSIDSETCIGCGTCIQACPYDVRTLIEDEPEFYLDVVVGEEDAPVHAASTVEKCTFCKNLIERGEVPACMQLCPGRARYWGDLDDPTSEVNIALEGRETFRFKENEGTSPCVFYLR